MPTVAVPSPPCGSSERKACESHATQKAGPTPQPLGFMRPEGPTGPQLCTYQFRVHLSATQARHRLCPSVSP